MGAPFAHSDLEFAKMTKAQSHDIFSGNKQSLC